MPAGRPTLYSEEYAEQGYKLALLGMTDGQIAWFFDISIERLALWAWEHEVFFSAITPTQEQRSAHAEIKVERRRLRAERRIKRVARNPGERVANAMRGRMWAALKEPHGGGLLGRLPYTTADLMAHLEARFQPGMGWHNYGKWHVDHKKPCARFNQSDPVEFQECWALFNLQPLWAADNIRKSARYAGS